MGTERLPSLMAAEDSTRTWRFEIDKDLRMALGVPGTWKVVAVHRYLNVVRPTTGDNAEIGFYTGGELGTTYEHAIKLETTGDLNIKSYNGGAFTNAISISPAGVVTLNGAKILRGSTTKDMASIASGASGTFTITVTGASNNTCPCVLGFGSTPEAGLIWEAYITAADTVTVRATNVTAASIDPANRSYSVAVFQV